MIKKISLLIFPLAVFPIECMDHIFYPGKGNQGAHFFDQHIAYDNCGSERPKPPVKNESTFRVDMQGRSFPLTHQGILGVCDKLITHIEKNSRNVPGDQSSIEGVVYVYRQTDLNNPFNAELVSVQNAVEVLNRNHNALQADFLVKIVFEEGRIKTAYIEGDTESKMTIADCVFIQKAPKKGRRKTPH